MREALVEARARASAAEARAGAAEAWASEESAKTAQALAAFEQLAQGSKQWPPSAPLSRGGSGFSGGPDETHQPSGATGGG
jgi:hypothetical protein